MAIERAAFETRLKAALASHEVLLGKSITGEEQLATGGHICASREMRHPAGSALIYRRRPGHISDRASASTIEQTFQIDPDLGAYLTDLSAMSTR